MKQILFKSSHSKTKQAESLLRIFEDIHNHVYANDGLSSTEVFEQFTKLLVSKIFDEKNGNNKFRLNLKESEKIEEEPIQKKVASRVHALFDKVKVKYNDFFENGEKIEISDASIIYIVSKLQTVQLAGIDSDVKGLAFQKFLNRQQRKDRGQFFTPEPVVNLMIQIIRPKVNEKILDPAAGSGGFLDRAIDYMKIVNKRYDPKSTLKKDLYGIEINPLVARTSLLRALLEYGQPLNIANTNSLENIQDLNRKLSICFNKSKVEDFRNYFDVILTNPPFGTQGKIKQKKLLSEYELGHKWEPLAGEVFRKTNIIKDGQTPEILFIERCLELLKPGGRMGMVLPNGHFENSTLGYLRSYIKEKAKILGVINLPPETFIPFGTGVKTSVLFLQKKLSQQKDNYKIFFGTVKKIGYQANKSGTPTYKVTKEGEYVLSDGLRVIDEDCSFIGSSYGDFLNNRLKGNDDVFIMPSNRLSDRLDYDYYHPRYLRNLEKIKKGNHFQLKEIVEIIKRKPKKIQDKETQVEYVELSRISSAYSSIIGSETVSIHELPSRAQFILKSGDIVTAVAGNSIGTKKHVSAFVDEEFDRAICTNGLRILNPIKEIDKYYLLFFLRSPIFLEQVYRLRTGAAIPSLSDSDLGEILIPIPKKNIIKNISDAVKKSISYRKKSQELITKENLLI